MTFAALNGTILPADQVFISPEDRGFRFGDGVFETIRITRGKIYLWEDHLARLEAGLAALGISLETSGLHLLATALIAKNDVVEGILRIAISRGVGSRGYVPTDPEPTCYVTAASVAMETASPRRLIVSHYRKISPSSLPTHLKLANGLNSILAVLEARQSGADDALVLDAEGNIAESSNANIFWRREGVIYTPSLKSGCLAGIMRKRFLALVPGIKEVMAPLETVLKAEAVLLTNSAAYVIPVAKVGDMEFASSIWADAWRQLIEADISRHIR